MTIARLFKIRGDTIGDILPVFDTAGMAPHPDAPDEPRTARR